MFEPNRDLAKKVDRFISKSIRSLLSIPYYTPNAELQYIGQYSSFYDRWHDCTSRFLNHLSVKANRLDLVQFQPKVKMSFSMRNKVTSLYDKNKRHWQTIKRAFPKPENINCPSCNSNHAHVNKYFACATPPTIPKAICDKSRGLALEIPEEYLGRIAETQNRTEFNKITVFTDASYHEDTNEATAAMVFITNDRYWFKIFNLKRFHPDSSTRAEIAAICLAIYSLKDTAYMNNIIEIFTDSDPSKKIFNKVIKNEKNLHKLCGIDLIGKTSNFIDPEKLKIHHVNGHDNEDPLNLNNLADYLTHFHDRAKHPPFAIYTKYKPKKLPLCPYFRLSQLFSNHTLEQIEQMLANLYNLLAPDTG